MATAAPPAPATTTVRRGVPPLRAGEGHSYLMRRLHSLTGLIPIGAFLIEHIVSNFEATNGPLAYAQQVKFLNSLPLVRVLEWAFIFLPLSYHALYGVYIGIRGRSNVNVYPWAGNWGYYAQRITGYIAFAYIVQHVWRQRFSGVSLPEHPGAAFHKVQMELHNPWMLAIYVIAMIATCWHFAYGIWLFAAKWGITPGDNARKKFGYVCAAVGTGLCVMGLWGMYAFISPKYQNAPADVMPEATKTSPKAPVPEQPGKISANSGDPYAAIAIPDSSNGQVAMFDPDGVVRLVPADQITTAKHAGGAVAIKVLNHNGTTSWVREDELDEALKNGATAISSR